jgi:hypothetical protein
LAVVAEAEALVVVLQVGFGGGGFGGGFEVEDSAADLVEAGKIFKYKPLHLEKRANYNYKKIPTCIDFFNYYFSNININWTPEKSQLSLILFSR